MSTVSGNPLPITKFDNTLGSLLLGGMIAMALWGVTCVQTYTYFTRPLKDRPFLRTMIAFLLVLDTFDSALNIHIVYHYMVTNYLNPLALLAPVWSVIIHVAVTAFSNFIIRILFAQRIYRLSRGNIPITGWIVVVSMADLVVGIIITVKAFGIASYPDLSQLSDLMYLTFAVGTGSDLSVAAALCFLLSRSRTGLKQTDSMIKVLMIYTVNTGLVVAIDASLGMIMYIVMPNNFIFLGFYLLLSKLYLNSYLATMNTREVLREKINEPVSIHLSEFSQSRRYEIESVVPVISEKSTRNVRRDGVAVSIETFLDKQPDYTSHPPVTTTSESIPKAF